MHALLAILALTTADVCAERFAVQVKGPECCPEYCRIYAPLAVATPWFSLIVQADLLIGIDRGGRRLRAPASIPQTFSGFVIEVVPIPADRQVDPASSYHGSLYLTGRLACRDVFHLDGPWAKCGWDPPVSEYDDSALYVREAGGELYLMHYWLSGVSAPAERAKFEAMAASVRVVDGPDLRPAELPGE